MFRLDNKIAVVTGGSGVLGSAMSAGLAAAGATVVVIGRNVKQAQLTADGINDIGGTAIAISADVLNKQELIEAAAQITQRYGRIDILVNGAGGNKPDAIAVPGQRSFFDLPQEALQWVLDLNVMGSLLPSQVFGAMMTTQKAGNIINISSMASYAPLTRVVAYAAGKAAINNFTQWLAVYMAREHSPAIRVNAIAPGFFLGDQNRALLIDTETGELTPRGKSVIDHTPMGRFGAADDLVGTLVWLASDAARFVTGVVVPVDGGFSAFSGV